MLAPRASLPRWASRRSRPLAAPRPVFLGKLDGKVTRDESLANARLIVEATDLPVSADLEKCFGDAPSMVAETIRLAASVGLVGGSVEDATGDKDRPLYDIGQATERVAAAAEAARALPFSFTLT